MAPRVRYEHTTTLDPDTVLGPLTQVWEDSAEEGPTEELPALVPLPGQV